MPSPTPHRSPRRDLAEQVDAAARRKLVALNQPSRGVWLGLGMMGMVGWSVAVPTLLGAWLGSWLDARHPGGRSWTLALLVAGLALGCLNAWHWVAKANRDEDHDVSPPPPGDASAGDQEVRDE